MTLTALFFGLSLVLAPSRAVPPDKPPPVQRFDFDEDEVEGGLHGPDGEAVTGRPTDKPSSLIRPRTSFVPELVRSAEQR